ncbi:MAG TPA: hypothetical protein VNB23_16090, partial [Ramlibacter sp.]|nr:hypothetical protein [Ramlibacter sp.]
PPTRRTLMANNEFRASAEQWLARFDTQAHQAIGQLREGSDRLGTLARSRWDTAFAQSSPKLSEETRRNASHARDVFSRWYVKGVDLGATGAERAVDAVVRAAGTAVGHAADWRARRA